MSSALICNMTTHVHNFRDDLESSIYVLLWVALIYSEASDCGLVVVFLMNVLDPQPSGTMGGSSKADFLQAWTFLKQIQFPGQLKLHHLIDQLAQLFAVRYETEPDSTAKLAADQYQSFAEKNKQPVLWHMFNSNPVYTFDQRMSKLEDHVATIALFDKALAEGSQWPDSDLGVKQTFLPRPPSQAVIKTGWHTRTFEKRSDLGKTAGFTVPLT
jgi:hypothetical protein